MKFFRILSLVILLPCSVKASSGNVILENETGQVIKLSTVVKNYSTITSESDFIKESMTFEEKISFSFSVLSSDFKDALPKIKTNELMKDGLYFNIDGQSFAITWYALQGNVSLLPFFEPLVTSDNLKQYHITTNKENPVTFSFKIQKNESPLLS